MEGTANSSKLSKGEGLKLEFTQNSDIKSSIQEDNYQIKTDDNVDFSEILSSEDYIVYTVLYGGSKTRNAYAFGEDMYFYIINESYAIAAIKLSLNKRIGNTILVAKIINKLITPLGLNVFYVSPPEIYTLQELSAIEASEVESVQSNLPLDLMGTGVTVAVIDTGIDYLNEEFTDKNGKSRIDVIWDQSLKSIGGDNVPFGREYSNDEIQRAIEAKRSGGNPYEIVESKDENGHGTHMAGIVGASGKNPEIRGMAPECNFLIIKLFESNTYDKFFTEKINKYNLASIISALDYIRSYAIKNQKPVVVLLPLGTNSGNHKGSHILDSFITTISRIIGIVVVSGAGNEGISDGHVSGNISDVESCETVELIVSPNQKGMILEVWVDLPNIVDIEITSPSGETTGIIPAILNNSDLYPFTFEKTEVSVYYYFPEEYTGDELIRVYFKNITEGIWRIKLCLRLGKNARYNAWIFQSGLSDKGTRFTPSDPYGTIQVPSDTPIVITAAAYNQNNNNLLSYSGMSFRDIYLNNIDFAAGGVNTKTVGLNNTIAVINGTSLSAAIGAGACCLLYQWGIIQKNYPYMYAKSVKTFLSRGTIQRSGDVYPNSQWGFGILSIYEMFDNMK